VLDSDWSVAKDGRDRISTRPGMTSTGGSIGVPRSWAEAIWTDSGAQRGVQVACDNGVWRSADGASWVELITDSASSDFASTTSFIGVAYFARAGQTCLFRAHTAGSGAGTALSNAGGGTAPTNCGLVAHHQDRLVLAGDTAASQTVYFSATGDPTDWDYADTTLGTAIPVSFTLPEQPTALISHTRDCFLFGCLDSIHRFLGNPATGELDRVSHYVGPLNQASWAHDAAGNLWYLSRDGLMRMPAGCGDFSTSVSREALPSDLVALNPGTAGTYTSIAYDPRFRCLWVFVDLTSSANDVFWSFNLQSPHGGWRRHTFTNGPWRVGATLNPASSSTKSALLAINASGSVYQFDTASTESFTSKCIYDPLHLGTAGMEGILHAVQASIVTNSDDVSWAVAVGQTAMEAADNAIAGTYAFTGADWSDGLSTWQFPRRRAAYACLVLFGSGTDRWSVERIDCQLHSARMLRRIA